MIDISVFIIGWILGLISIAIARLLNFKKEENGTLKKLSRDLKDLGKEQEETKQRLNIYIIEQAKLGDGKEHLTGNESEVEDTREHLPVSGEV